MYILFLKYFREKSHKRVSSSPELVERKKRSRDVKHKKSKKRKRSFSRSSGSFIENKQQANEKVKHKKSFKSSHSTKEYNNSEGLKFLIFSN